MPDPRMNLQDEIQKLLQKHLSDYLVGAAQDLQLYAQQIAADGTAAAALGRQDLIDELGKQARTLGEAMRLRASNAGWATVSDIIVVVFTTLIAGLSA